MKSADQSLLVWYRRIVTSTIVILFVLAGWVFLGTYAPESLNWLPIPSQLVAVVLALAAVLSLFVGVLRATIIAKQSPALSTLANELSQVSNKSDIVINSIGDGVVALNNKGVIELINPAAQNMLGWGYQDAIGLDFNSIFKLVDMAGDPVPDTANPIAQGMTSDTSLKSNDFVLVTNSGKKMNVSLLVSPVGQDGNGGVIVVFRDISSEVSKNQERTEFVSTASHEMRTPVAAIEGYLGLALNPQTATIDDKARTYITKAHESSQHLGRLFQDLLDISQAEDGRLKSTPTVIELIAFLREMVELHNPAAAEKGLKMVFKPDAPTDSQTITPIFYVFGDADHMREIVSNLIENAIKYTKTGSITVDVTGTAEKSLISISDTGIGISREDLPHLFQKFYRVDNTATREIGGTGLGLYLCRRLVESMNGRIWAESEVGKGSTFLVELDRLSSEEADLRLNTQLVVPEPPPPQ